ncbi:MAG: radical SAM protein [Candidatus Binataceae bacterium]
MRAARNAQRLFADQVAGPAGQTRGVTFEEMPVRQILNRCDSPRMPFRWTINPYRGCEFGCVYCYARYTHEFLDLRDPLEFERRIFVKRAAADVLVRTLARTPIGSDAIAIGTATDPYQPAERAFNVTRSILEAFAKLGGLNLSITTKSALITRDLDLLQRINCHSRLSVNFSLITLDRRLQRILEPRAPRPALRLRALMRLAQAGIRCNVLVMPIIPGITDSAESLERVVKSARIAGADSVWSRSLFLKPAAARRFIPFIEEKFPHLRERVRTFYGRSAFAPSDYDESISAIFDRIRAKHGFALGRERYRVDSSRPIAAAAAQLNLIPSAQAAKSP